MSQCGVLTKASLIEQSVFPTVALLSQFRAAQRSPLKGDTYSGSNALKVSRR